MYCPKDHVTVAGDPQNEQAQATLYANGDMCVKWKANTGQTLSQLVSVTDGYPLYIPEPTTDEPTTDAPPSQPLAWVSTPGLGIILSPEAQRPSAGQRRCSVL